MKKFIIFILLFSNIAVKNSYASSDALASAAVAMALSGTIYSINSFQYDEWLKSEMESWKYEETNLTTSLSRTCDVNMELRLHRGRRTSFVTFVIHNQKNEAIIIRTNDIDATYSNGAVRKLKSNIVAPDYKVDPGWTIQGIYPISEKEELTTTDFIDIRVPTISIDGKSQCDLRGRLNKNKNRIPDYNDYHRLLSAEFGFFYGNSLISSASLRNSAENRGLFGFFLNAYIYKNFGFTLGFLRQDFKNNNNSSVKSSRNIPGEVSLAETDMMIGVAANFLYGRKYSISLNSGLLAHSLVNDRDQASRIEDKIGLYLNSNFNYIFYSSELRPFHGDYMVGVGMLAKSIPKYSIGDAQFGGLSVSPYVNLNVGF